MTRVFTMRSARSGAFLAVLGGALAIETSVLHVVVQARHPWIAWALTATSLSALWWIVADHAALASTTIEVDAEMMRGAVGRRASFVTKLTSVTSIERPQLMPTSGPPNGYLNITKPASPNALIVFRPAVTMTVLGMPRSVTQLAIRVDEPEVFMRVTERQ